MNDAGSLDAGVSDAGRVDGGMSDSGPQDAGASDSGMQDAGVTDAGTLDAGPSWQQVFGGGFTTAFWAFNASDVWAGGATGKLMHFNGTEWQVWPAPAISRVSGLWGAAPDDVWAVGPGAILHFDGTRWSFTGAGLGTFPNAIWGTSASDVWVGTNGGLMRFDGTTWATVTTGFTAQVSAIHGTSPNDVWVATYDGNTLHFDGAQWSSASVNGSSYPVSGVWALSPTEVYALTTSTSAVTLSRWSGTQWQPTSFTQSGSAETLWAPPGGPLYVATSEGIRLWSGTTQSSLTTRPVNALGGSTGGDIWVQEGDGINLRITDAGISTVVAPGQHLLAVASFGPDDVWVAGARGLMMHKTDSRFHQVLVPTTHTLRSLWGSNSSDIWACGDQGTLLHFTNGQWVTVNSNTTMRLSKVWGTSGNDIYALAEQGYYLRFNGVTWSQSRLGTSIVRDVWGPNPNGVWAIASSVAYRPPNWASSEPFGYSALTLWGSASNDIWIAGSSGGLSHFDGTTWSAVALSPTAVSPRAIWGSASNDVWLIAASPAFRHWNGVTWLRDPWSSANALNAINGSSATDVWAVTDTGVILTLR